MTTITGRAMFPYHSQIFDNFCGPASVQMILEFLGVTQHTQTDIANVGDATPSLTGATLYDSWSSRPDEVVNMLQVLAPAINLPFVQQGATKYKDFRLLLKGFVEDVTIPPPITPIHGGGGHWVVFFQYRVKNGRGSFYGNDPLYHGENDSMSPNLPPVFINLPDRPGSFSPPNRIAIVESPTVVALRITSGAPTRRYVAAVEVPMTCGDDYNFPQEQGGDVSDPPASGSSEQFPPQKIPKQVIKELIAYGVIDPDDPDRPLNNFSPGDPLLVKTPDSPSEHYYLIGLQNSEKQNRLLARLGAYDGQYLDSITIPPTRYLLGRSSIKSKIIERVYDQLVNKLKKDSWYRAFEEELSRTNKEGMPEPNLFWKPCKESLSPFYPFYEVKADEATFYVRIDGVVFLKLTAPRMRRKATVRNKK